MIRAELDHIQRLLENSHRNELTERTVAKFRQRRVQLEQELMTRAGMEQVPAQDPENLCDSRYVHDAHVWYDPSPGFPCLPPGQRTHCPGIAVQD